MQTCCVTNPYMSSMCRKCWRAKKKWNITVHGHIAFDPSLPSHYAEPIIDKLMSNVLGPIVKGRHTVARCAHTIIANNHFQTLSNVMNVKNQHTCKTSVFTILHTEHVHNVIEKCSQNSSVGVIT